MIDWAFRKGINYGTVLIDMETSRPVDLLPSRDAKDLKKWLDNHKHIEIVTRYQASSYASAIWEVHPNAHQVADRFHLLMNLPDALTFYFKNIASPIFEYIEIWYNRKLLHSFLGYKTPYEVEQEFYQFKNVA